MCGVYVVLGLSWLIVCALHWRDILRIQFWIGMFCSQEFFLNLFPDRWCDLPWYGGEGNVSGRVPEYKQFRPGELASLTKKWARLKLECLFAGHRRVDSGGRGGL